MQKFTKEQVYILSSIDYYGYAIITKEDKSKVWQDALSLVDLGYIKKKSVHYRNAIFIATDKLLEVPLGYRNRRYSTK